jgi:hypothetical protein
LTRETGIAILDKAADIGLLTAHGGGYYTIHPALPWFFRRCLTILPVDTDDRPDQDRRPPSWSAVGDNQLCRIHGTRRLLS